MRQSSPEVHTFFDEATNAACHIVKDPASNAVAIIDSILILTPQLAVSKRPMPIS